MKISDFLSPAQVMIDVKASDKVRLLEQLSTEAAAATGLAADEVVREIAKREELGSTGVGNGVALPHARLPSLKTPFAAFRPSPPRHRLRRHRRREGGHRRFAAAP